MINFSTNIGQCCPNCQHFLVYFIISTLYVHKEPHLTRASIVPDTQLEFKKEKKKKKLFPSPYILTRIKEKIPLCQRKLEVGTGSDKSGNENSIVCQ